MVLEVHTLQTHLLAGLSVITVALHGYCRGREVVGGDDYVRRREMMVILVGWQRYQLAWMLCG